MPECRPQQTKRTPPAHRIWQEHFVVCPRLSGFAAAAHFFEQYFTRSQSRSHFFLQANSRLQCAHGLVGS